MASVSVSDSNWKPLRWSRLFSLFSLLDLYLCHKELFDLLVVGDDSVMNHCCKFQNSVLDGGITDELVLLSSAVRVAVEVRWCSVGRPPGVVIGPTNEAWTRA